MVNIKVKDRVSVNDGWHVKDKIAQVMALAEGYAMVRYPSSYPFVTPVNELELVHPE